MDDGLVSTSKVVAGCMWTLVISLLVAAWLTAIYGALWIGGLLAATACATSAVAATMQIRVYSLGVCGQLRVVRAEVQNQGRRPEGPTMRSL